MTEPTASAPFSEADHVFMDHALRLGRRGLGLTFPNPAVGCVLVKDGIVVGRGVTQPGGRPHGETTAIAHAGAAARGATAYVTLEPCSHYGRTAPCSDALARAGIVRVVCAIGDPDPRVHGRGFTMLKAYGIAVETGLGAAEAALDHRGHFNRVRLGRPLVQLKMALSADGLVAGEGGRPVQISGPRASCEVHLMRAMADAIMVGIGTVLADDPMLTCRLPGMADRSPIRIVLDPRLRTPVDARLVATARQVPTWIIGAVDAAPEAERWLRSAGAEVMRVGRTPNGDLDLSEALRLVATRGITRVLAETGPTLAKALIGADLADEIVLVRSPVALGAGLAAFDRPLPGRFRLAQALPSGPDMIEIYR
ncbi:bifunctional diaminohydroxyphosphoribosylaminopyrimidine deaminase/5-amino-6-(5-phosphoribosylamino)uracil reductase RibD [Phreatobacter sp. AB_2022a]|uniref:bifunctional diaminohydroxyphosphoribosylaminopyrimidine deaminase/5-amino-6-(5-phosphoribosylamino)uracil reductase RibD n=1 Tax=Phreatobacter sp. AB_2022a TaxID=3003134 RepID=UPI0022876570|nr:bifunctional diaminohydroxyphosphoribosylaminopyrimidine deaminase/5-amino-6-(5-phosphoribosylamino)uracil reductase RibD [Phreatobacter sp. AB_2022a]MCZ0736975.1 bifunctional diaminohydroxyphosphoribosylaminopyrimidine deaminase/5-amino-6-(5-phosphoribosylamino)uracil reductase RibD [Phreatobacter sp. AB_2022a]